MSKILHNFFSSVLNNIKSIVTAVVVSLVVWFAVSLQIFPDVTTHINDIPIQIFPTELMLDENLQIDTSNISTTSVQIQGKRYDITKLNASDFEAYLDLSDVKGKGSYEVGLIINAVDEGKCEIISQGLTRHINVEKIASKTLEINVSADKISIADGLQLDEAYLDCNPPTVTITGKDDLVNSITRAEVTVNYDGDLTASTELKGEISFYNDRNIKIDKPDVGLDSSYFTVTVPVHKIKTLPLEFIITGYPSNFDIDSLMERMEISPKELTISSPNNSIDSLSQLNVGEMALSDLTYRVLNGYTRATIAPWLAEGYRSISGNASYSLSFKNIENYVSLPFTLTRDNISIVNSPTDYEVDILTDEIVVNVIGPANHVQALSIDDISITINLMGIEITEGSKTVKLSSWRISGSKVPSWIADTPQIDLYFRAIN